MRKFRAAFLALICASTAIAPHQLAFAAQRKHGKIQRIIQDDRYADFVIDANTGQILHAVNEDAQRYPASLTKMMTLYLAFEALQAGKLSMTDTVPVSRHAAMQAPSSIGVQPGERVLLRDIVLATIIKSANDAAVVLAEALGGSEDHFAEMMTAKARALGMRQTRFHNASGLPDDEQKTTARDMATLGAALFRDFPQYYPLFSRTSFEFRGQTIGGHNRLMARYKGADGIKTGFINKSGFNLVTSAERDGRRLVGVVLGGDTSASRDQRMAVLLDQGFSALPGQPRPAPDRAMIAGVQPETRPAKAETPASASQPFAEPAQVTFNVATGAVQPVATETAPEAAEPPAKPASKSLKFPSLIGRAEAATGNGMEGMSLRGQSASGWVIQLGAFSKPKLAEAMLHRASDAAPHLLQGAETVIVKSNSGSKTFYRARMVGFDEDQAQSACRSLKDKKFNCLVLSPAASSL